MYLQDALEGRRVVEMGGLYYFRSATISSEATFPRAVTATRDKAMSETELTALEDAVGSVLEDGQ